MSVRVLKPVVSGYPGDDGSATDTAILLKSLGIEPTQEAVEACSPWRFTEPLSPDMAARREGRTIDFEALVGFCRDAQGGAEDRLPDTRRQHVKTLFVTASGTGTGKTYVTAALAQAFKNKGLSVRVLKPVVSGFRTPTARPGYASPSPPPTATKTSKGWRRSSAPGYSKTACEDAFRHR